MDKKVVLTERNVIVEVLEKYKKLPFLWNPTHKLYTNKNARRRGLEIMLKIWQKLEPNANIECLRKKLNNWRASYRRERKKVEDSYISASEPDEFHKPNLWYYNYLTFINDDCPVLSTDDDDAGVLDELTSEDDESKDGDASKIDNKDGSEDVGGHHISDEQDHEVEEEPVKKPRLSVKQETVDAAQNLDESSADLFGRAIGSQLKEVSKFQRCLAEKLISEIMFYAKLDQLTIGTSVNLDSSNS